MDAEAKPAVPGLSKLLSDSDLNVKLDAASALGADWARMPLPLIPQLAAAMQEGPTALTLTSASALGMPSAKPPCPALNEMINPMIRP